MTIELRDLRWVIAASQHRSLRQTAETLKIRQATLSQRMRYLEHRIQAQLFVRTNGGTSLTDAGLDLLEAAQRIVADSDATIERLKLRSRTKTRQLRIGVFASPATGNMHATLVEHHERFPAVHIHLVDGTHDQLLWALAGNIIDIAIMTACRAHWDGRTLPLWTERVIAALPQNHSLGARDTIRWPELAKECVLVSRHGPGPELERLLMSKLQDAGPQQLLHQDAALDRLLSMVSAKYGMLLMLEGGTGVHTESVIFREVGEEQRPTRLNFMAYWRDSNSNPALRPFLDMLRRRYPDLSSAPEPD
jgi:DNA-binding transcriptional LysR family regulator